jgi:hypothetical protein
MVIRNQADLTSFTYMIAEHFTTRRVVWRRLYEDSKA